MKHVEPQIPDHIVAYLLARYEASAQVALDAVELKAATMYRLSHEARGGKWLLTSNRISQESAVGNNGDYHG